nr:hypothetical protein Iba_chr09eCG12680 [Ipomoea batatas]GMD39456.1 hypothetical protein Iba_chr09fCG13710 [Ipomoea batatas]
MSRRTLTDRRSLNTPATCNSGGSTAAVEARQQQRLRLGSNSGGCEAAAAAEARQQQWWMRGSCGGGCEAAAAVALFLSLPLLLVQQVRRRVERPWALRFTISREDGSEQWLRSFPAVSNKQWR